MLRNIYFYFFYNLLFLPVTIIPTLKRIIVFEPILIMYLSHKMWCIICTYINNIFIKIKSCFALK